MRLASFNVLHGRSPSDGRAEADRLTRAVSSLDVAVLALQEVDRHQPRSGGVDQTGLAAAALGAEWSRFEPTLLGMPGQSWRPTGGAGALPVEAGGPAPAMAANAHATELDGPAYGVALVSRLPVREWHAVRLPRAPVRSPALAPRGRRRSLVVVHDEPRVALAAVVETEQGPLTVASAHLSFVPGWNLVQLRRLCARLELLPEPRILLGDLNVPGPLPQWATGWRRLAAVRTYPAARPRVQVDHALGHGRLPAVGRVDSLALEVSDHRALVVELTCRR